MPNELKRMFKVDLQLFNDGGATGGAEGSVANTENAPKTDVKPSGSSRRSKSGEFENVVFGKQESTPSTETTSLATEGEPTGAGNTEETLEDRKKAYNDFIEKYKDIDQQRFQETFDRRFKQVKGMEAELETHKEITDMLKSVYNVDDVKQAINAFKEDRTFWELVAEEKGLSYEQYQAVMKLDMENKELKAIQNRQLGEQKAAQQLNAWNEEAKAVKQLYPSFDLRKEVQNKAFLDMLKSGLSMEHAYKVLHFDELTQNAARVAAQTADAQAQARIKQKASRPSENGTSSQSAAIVRNDVKTLTRKERAEIARRVARGEKISF